MGTIVLPLNQVRRRDVRRVLGSLVVALLLLAAPARADKEQVRKVMDAMEKAVLAGDKEAYLANVWKDDACFLQEQKNWALDFDRHRAAAFAIAINDEQEQKFEEDAARFTLVMTWSMGDDVPRGKDRKVSFPVIFRRQDDKWLFGGEDWKVVEAGGVDGSAGAIAKYLGEGEIPAQNVIAVLPEVRAHVDAGFENKIDRVQEVKLYKSMRHLQESIYLSYTDSLGGWNEPKEAIKALSIACSTKRDAKQLLAHEYGHVATFEYGPHTSQMPWWVLEGVAELSADEFKRGAREETDADVKRWARKGQLAPWDEMADFYKCPKKWMGHVYGQGHHMVAFVTDKWGRPKMNQWLRLMAQGKTIDEASKESLEVTFAELDKQWRQALPEQEEGTAPGAAPAESKAPAEKPGDKKE